MTEALERFLTKRPAIRLQYEHEGSFRDYGRRFFNRVPLGRGARLTRHIVEYAKAQAGLPVDERLLRAQLNQFPLVSSADHAGVLNQGILFNANLLYSGLLDLQSLPYQVVLASHRIPLSNLSHPRGITFQGKKHNFFTKKHSHMPVWLFEDGIRPEQAENLETLFRPETLKFLTREQKKFFQFLFSEAVKLPRVARTCFRFRDQLTLINHNLWPLYFEKAYRLSRPALLTVPIEALVESLLLEDLRLPGSLPFRILFDRDVRSVYLEEFAGIVGCWGPESGTQFFWGKDEDGGMVALEADEVAGLLVSRDRNRTWAPVSLTPEAIIAAIQEKRVVPSLFFEMLLVGFLEGYTLLGGFNQVTYMAWMRVAHERAMLRLGDWPMAAWFARTLTDGLICGPLPFPQWDSGFDLLWHFNSTNGVFHGNLDGGLGRPALETMMGTPMKDLIQNGLGAMLQVVD